MLQKSDFQCDPDLAPPRIKRVFRTAVLSSGMFALRKGFRNPLTFRWLRTGWGNKSMSADISYLEAVFRWASGARGPILECGSGLTTVLLGMVAPHHVTTLEHMPEWKDHVELVAKKHSVPVNVLLAPLPLPCS